MIVGDRDHAICKSQVPLRELKDAVAGGQLECDGQGLQPITINIQPGRECSDSRFERGIQRSNRRNSLALDFE